MLLIPYALAMTDMPASVLRELSRKDSENRVSLLLFSFKGDLLCQLSFMSDMASELSADLQ